MEISTLQIIAIFLFSCIAGMGSVLDEFQTHRPLIACTVIGLILGDLKTGIMLGGTLELIALGWMNVGAAQSPDSALASIISAILVIVGQQSIATGIAIALPVAAAGQVLTVFARTITVVFQHAADKAAEDARFRTIDILHVSALGVQALRVAIPALIVSLFVSADMVSNMLNAIPEFVTRGLQIAGGFIVVVGYAMVLRMMGVIGAFNANYHLQEGSYNHTMGIRPQGRTLILGGTGPMGLLAIDYALHGPINPSLLIVTDINNDKLNYARKHYPSEPQTLIHYLNAADTSYETLMALSGGHGFDDIFVFVPNEQLVTLASSLLAADGCMNFFAGPQDKHFSAPINFYDVHYAFTHYVGTSGGNTDDMRAAVKLIEEKKVQAAKVVTHILGLNAAGETTLELPAVGGGKKLVYTGKNLPLTSLTQIQDEALAAILARHRGVWSGEAEQYLLAHAEAISHD